MLNLKEISNIILTKAVNSEQIKFYLKVKMTTNFEVLISWDIKVGILKYLNNYCNNRKSHFYIL